MDDSQQPSTSSSSNASVGNQCRRVRPRYPVEDEFADPAGACTGRSCQSCTAGVIADCVAMCCCPCAVVNFMALAFVKLPWAVARRCLAGHRRRLEEKRKRRDGDKDAISGNGRAVSATTSSEIVFSGSVIGDELNDHFSAEFKADDVWLEVYDEVGHLGFGRVSFTGISFQNKGN